MKLKHEVGEKQKQFNEGFKRLAAKQFVRTLKELEAVYNYFRGEKNDQPERTGKE